jgi:hypothetical protein
VTIVRARDRVIGQQPHQIIRRDLLYDRWSVSEADRCALPPLSVRRYRPRER